MKKTILAIFMAVMISKPCFAQEIKPDGLFSIEGTLWQVSDVAFYPFLPFLPFLVPGGVYENTLGFFDGSGYRCDENEENCYRKEQLTYVDLGFVSIAWVRNNGPYNPNLLPPVELFNIYVMQPFGVGIHIYEFVVNFYAFYLTIGTMLKTNDNWVAPATIYDIYPSSAEQGTTLTDVLIDCISTTFQDNPPVEIWFDPPDGLTVSNIDVISNTEIEFDLEIAVDAPTVSRHLIVTYDDGNQVITKIIAFEVLPKTN